MRISDWSSDVCSSDLGVRKTRRHLCVDARGLQRHGKALLDRRPRRPLGKPQRRRALGLLDEFGLRRLAVDGVEQVLGIGQRQQDCAVAKFADRVDVDVRPGERSEEHTSELKSLMRISYAVFCLKKKKTNTYNT